MQKYGITVDFATSLQENPNKHLVNDANQDPLAFINYKNQTTSRRNKEMLKTLQAKEFRIRMIQQVMKDYPEELA